MFWDGFGLDLSDNMVLKTKLTEFETLFLESFLAFLCMFAHEDFHGALLSELQRNHVWKGILFSVLASSLTKGLLVFSFTFSVLHMYICFCYPTQVTKTCKLEIDLFVWCI